jgi:hypothetical protein
MSDDRGWEHAGISPIKGNGSRTVRIPDKLFREEEILTLGKWVQWHYEKTTDVLIVSHNDLDEEDYEYSNKSTKFREGDSEYTCVVPKIFFEDYIGKGDQDIQPRAADVVNLAPDERLHFIYHSEMAEGRIKSCYALTDEQFDERFTDSDVWNGQLDQVPKFFS